MTQVLAQIGTQNAGTAASAVVANNRSAAANPVSNFEQVFSSVTSSSNVAQASTDAVEPMSEQQLQALKSYIEDLKGQGVSLEELLQGIDQAKNTLSGLGITGDMLKQVGLSDDILQKLGFDAESLEQLGFTHETLKELGFSDEALKELGFAPNSVALSGQAPVNPTTQTELSTAGTTKDITPPQAILLGYLIASQKIPGKPLLNSPVQAKAGESLSTSAGNSWPASTASTGASGMPAFLTSLLEGNREGGEKNPSSLVDLSKLTKLDMVGQSVNKDLFQSIMKNVTKEPGQKLFGAESALPSSVSSLATPLTSILTPGQQLLNSAAAMPTVNVQAHVNQPGWDQAVASRVMFLAKNNVQAAKLTLNPNNLGPIEVSISMKNEQANVSFVAQHGMTREALEQAIPRLREMFAANGLELSESNISDGQSAQQQHLASQQGEMAGHSGSADGDESAGHDGGKTGEDGGDMQLTASALNGVKVGLVDFYA